jgi:ubiquinone/menaquinone biosynthesis C-methylase UbiE
MKWYKKDVAKLSNISLPSDEDIMHAFDLKYGNYDYNEDARSLCPKEFETSLKYLIEEYSTNKQNVLVVGANSGYEVQYLVNNFDVTALDLSQTALKKLSIKHPTVKTILGNVNQLPFTNDVFNIYLGFRVLNSWKVDTKKSIDEAIRVIKKDGAIICSIPNGYILNHEIVKGIYDIDKEIFDKKYPYTLLKEMREYFFSNNMKLEILEIPSEIIIKAKFQDNS